MDLPPNGWLAHGAGVTAYTALCDGVVADYAETPTSVFANARAVEDWDLSGITPVRPTVGTFQQTGPRAFIVTYRWVVSGAPRNDYNCFVHFSKAGHDQFDESIRFQQDHGLPVPTSQWQPGSELTDGPHSITIPGDVEDGDYEWTIGLWKRELGRATIDGPMDSSGRILLGILRVSEKGEKLEFIPNNAPHASRSSMQRASLNENGRIVTFPTIRTNGSVLVEREEREWVLRTMPRNRPFILELNVDRFGKPSQIRCLDGDQPTVAPAASGGWWRLPMNGAREYRWEAQPQ